MFIKYLLSEKDFFVQYESFIVIITYQLPVYKWIIDILTFKFTEMWYWKYGVYPGLGSPSAVGDLVDFADNACWSLIKNGLLVAILIFTFYHLDNKVDLWPLSIH